MPERIQLSRAKGWRMPENTVKVDRSTRWGNPFKLHGDGYPMTQEMAVRLFRELLKDQGGYVTSTDPMKGVLVTTDDIRLLRGKNLACWCKLDTPCHADVLLELANAPEAGITPSGTARDGGEAPE